MKAFLSYQRSDTLFAAHVLFYAVRDAGHTAFVDTGSIGDGEAFHDVIRSELASTNVTLCLIGPRFDVDRLHSPGNVVSFEWRRSLFHGCGIVPVLVDGAEMPETESLPTELRWFCGRNAARLARPTLARDIDSLVSSIPELSATPKRAARVLWVDDKPANNEPERRTLRSRGIIFDNVVSTKEALDQIENAEYQLVITDLGRMGSSDRSNEAGFEFLSHPVVARGGPPVIVYTAPRIARRQRATLMTNMQVVEVTGSPTELKVAVLGVLGRTDDPLSQTR